LRDDGRGRPRYVRGRGSAGTRPAARRRSDYACGGPARSGNGTRDATAAGDGCSGTGTGTGGKRRQTKVQVVFKQALYHEAEQEEEKRRTAESRLSTMYIFLSAAIYTADERV